MCNDKLLTNVLEAILKVTVQTKEGSLDTNPTVKNYLQIW